MKSVSQAVSLGGWGTPLYRLYGGRAAGQGMRFGPSVLYRVYNFMRACPKQGLNLSYTGYVQYDVRR